ncbi:alpha/beta fold hydrolase [Sulfitobacter mediterraneus]|uniref:alpha/beta fold hydrolase n=1 Tax=Sulfitobacter mediterraneus TaxID=83219 RepID=UPI00193311EB|nr:alpha/beta fold hydrolase [Sulfitobacter mediterraneus]MBM1634369.1 alpha/beta fold hydrolase [Sulfitobacter mediterraneus]MBM1642186.1 alpha/beta fold hydrolase [Sulfitobacter mediterraneus]MBM1646235.1 alpha/beta fold hydrolase [Sulfitobacter mediterraneus]MBM1650281.1 alpha/beta fold hydrolase [Sulfitobacter mediterraneus]MBM1654303.1 alpha/beta fold hydrolase [Sulfitobacter mediterraneus]
MTDDFQAAQKRAQQMVRKLGIADAYPFDHHFAQTPMGVMHYVDEGAGDPVLMLHGNPTWSFLYRDFIAGVSDAHRVIAPDHIGFGLSDKPQNEASYTIGAHIRNLEALVTNLDLRNVTLVMQDWGGPIGLGMAARHPDRIKDIVVMNTFGFYPPAAGMDPDNLKLPVPLRVMRKPGIGDFIVRRLGFFERIVMKLATADSARLKSVHHAYKAVFEGRQDRAGVMAFPRLIPTRTADASAQILINETGPFLDNFSGRARIFWGMKDPLFPVAALDAWEARLPNAEVTRLPMAKHYMQEDAPDVIIPQLRTFLEG